ncbi:hypothetical protein ACNYS0_21040 [Streptomyces sp. BH034]|uniref:hypothetical protein n=1 Tax=Streptomyces sp. BH034 TaxID=3402626 RepID=UPI003BB812EC
MHISLRKKPAPEPEAEPVEETEPDDVEEPEPVDDGAALSLRAALVVAVKAWFAWSKNKLGATATYWGHALAVWACAYYRGWILLTVPAVFLLAVGLFIPRPAIDRFTARVEALHTNRRTAEPDPTEEAPTDPLVALLWHHIGDAPGVHLKTLVERLAKGAAEAGQEPPTRAEVEAKLAALRIPLRASVRNTAERVNRGVHRDDLTAALAASPEPTGSTAPDV